MLGPLVLQVKSHIWVFINSLIENPAFDSQTKETLTLKPSAFGSKAEFDDKFFKKMMSGTSILDSILSFGQDKQAKDMKKVRAGGISMRVGSRVSEPYNGVLRLGQAVVVVVGCDGDCAGACS